MVLDFPLASKLKNMSSAAMKYEASESFYTRNVDHITLPLTIKNACLKRKNSYLAGRICCQNALKNMRSDPCDFMPDSLGLPSWPEGMIGSISHSSSIAVALLAPTQQYHSIGVDVEELMPPEKSKKIAYRIAHPSEIDTGPHTYLTEEELVTLIFSAKESLYKALYPIYKKYFTFRDFALSKIDVESRTKDTISGRCEIVPLKRVKKDIDLTDSYKGWFYIDKLTHHVTYSLFSL